MGQILNEIIDLCDESYRAFCSRLLPGIDNILGLRMAHAVKIAKRYSGTNEGEEFLSSLPHTYHDENIVHAIMLGRLRADFNALSPQIASFLPFVTNWAVCDSLCAYLKRFFAFPESYAFALGCLKSNHCFTVRFGLVSLLDYFIDSEHIVTVLSECVRLGELCRKGAFKDADFNGEYYVSMAIAWLISICLVKQYDTALPVIEKGLLPKWIHNKSIQKATESLRIENTVKEYLKSLKIK